MIADSLILIHGTLTWNESYLVQLNDKPTNDKMKFLKFLANVYVSKYKELKNRKALDIMLVESRESRSMHVVIVVSHLEEVEAVQRRLRVPGEADEHLDVGRVQRRHQQVARHPHELEERHLQMQFAHYAW